MPGHDPQLLKGVLTLLLLQLLAERESHGYELVQRLHAIGLTEVLEGTVYPALSRIEREGHIEARLEASTSGPARKVYRPTQSGFAALTAGAEEWATFVDTVEAALGRPVPTHPKEGH